MAIASLTFESVFNNISTEESLLPDEDLALEGLTIMEELAEAEEELITLESIYSAKEALGIAFEEGETPEAAPASGDAAAGAAKKEPGKITAALGKIKEKIIAAWNWLVKQFTKIANFFNDLFQFNAKWFVKNKELLKGAWDTTSVNTTAKLKDPGTVEKVVAGTTDALTKAAAVMKDIDTSEKVEAGIKELNGVIDGLKKNSDDIFEKFDAKELPAKDIIAFNDAETLVTRNLVKVANDLRTANANSKKLCADGIAALKKTAKDTQDKSERARISATQKLFGLNRKVFTVQTSLCNKAASLAVKTAKAVFKKAGGKGEEPKALGGSVEDKGGDNKATA